MQENKCQICGKPATMHYIETINGITRETHYCSECANSAKANVFDPFETLYGTSNILNSIFGTPTIKREIVCDCGMSERELLNGCRFGCAKCYSTFESVAKRLVSNLGGGEYVGEQPANYKQSENNNQPQAVKAEKPKTEIEKLQDELDLAIKEQRFVDCDKIKNKLNKLRQDKKREG